uniref:Uncharacterized protein n=1 Tax=Arundo donax TaxID=35708 RepID=A0A0A9BPY9_ARUDO
MFSFVLQSGNFSLTSTSPS